MRPTDPVSVGSHCDFDSFDGEQIGILHCFIAELGKESAGASTQKASQDVVFNGTRLWVRLTLKSPSCVCTIPSLSGSSCERADQSR